MYNFIIYIHTFFRKAADNFFICKRSFQFYSSVNLIILTRFIITLKVQTIIEALILR